MCARGSKFERLTFRGDGADDCGLNAVRSDKSIELERNHNVPQQCLIRNL